jgi:CII-binding regulator of phage lambda lysogenization HflD
MEMINAVFLMVALVLVWGAINLERPSTHRVEVNQTDQLNESIKFLQRLKSTSAKEQSFNRRHQAYKIQLDSVVNEIPSTVEAIQASHEQNHLVHRRKAKQLQQLATGISSNVEQSIHSQQTSTSQSMDELLVLKEQISALHSTIPQLKNRLEQSSKALEQLNRDTEMVKDSVGY